MVLMQGGISITGVRRRGRSGPVMSTRRANNLAAFTLNVKALNVDAAAQPTGNSPVSFFFFFCLVSFSLIQWFLLSPHIFLPFFSFLFSSLLFSFSSMPTSCYKWLHLPEKGVFPPYFHKVFVLREKLLGY